MKQTLDKCLSWIVLQLCIVYGMDLITLWYSIDFGTQVREFTDVMGLVSATTEINLQMLI